ncbi:hypothetical protein EON65_15880 [archaeon]|nr:MAG: hypothetical protein EON65_15880 [archaeon]
MARGDFLLFMCSFIFHTSPLISVPNALATEMMIGLKRQKTFDIVPEHLISVRGLSMAFISLLLDMADEMKTLVTSQGGDDRLKHKVLATVFYEPSTRTSCSFQAAMLRLGGNVITLNEDSSSVKKGESLEDTIQTMSCYCDLIVLRHPAQGSAALAASVSTKSVVNAGDGTGKLTNCLFVFFFSCIRPSIQFNFH